MILFIVIISLVRAGIPDEFSCSAGPLIYGPECQATLAVGGWSNAMITYEIVDILSETNIECMGWGLSSVIECNKTIMNWYPLGVFFDSGMSRLFWGNNMDYPAIKCKGFPLPTGLKWKFTLVPQGYFGCCGKIRYQEGSQECCGGEVFPHDYKDNHVCCDIYWVDEKNCCEITGFDGEYKKNVLCPMGNCCQKDITTFETVCCDHACFNSQCFKSSGNTTY